MKAKKKNYREFSRNYREIRNIWIWLNSKSSKLFFNYNLNKSNALEKKMSIPFDKFITYKFDTNSIFKFELYHDI